MFSFYKVKDIKLKMDIFMLLCLVILNGQMDI